MLAFSCIYFQRQFLLVVSAKQNRPEHARGNVVERGKCFPSFQIIIDLCGSWAYEEENLKYIWGKRKKKKKVLKYIWLNWNQEGLFLCNSWIQLVSQDSLDYLSNTAETFKVRSDSYTSALERSGTHLQETNVQQQGLFSVTQFTSLFWVFICFQPFSPLKFVYRHFHHHNHKLLEWNLYHWLSPSFFSTPDPYKLSADNTRHPPNFCLTFLLLLRTGNKVKQNQAKPLGTCGFS